MDLKFYFSLFLRRIHYFLLFLAVGSAAGITLATVMPESYDAEATLLWQQATIETDGGETDANVRLRILREQLLTRETILELVNRLDAFLGFPKLDPHGDAIPGPNGRFRSVAARTLLSEAPRNIGLVVVGVVDGRDSFLRHLGVLGIALGTRLTVVERHAFDGSLSVRLNEGEESELLSPAVCERLWVDQHAKEPVIVFPDSNDIP